MYGIFRYIYPRDVPIVGKHSIHGAYGNKEAKLKIACFGVVDDFMSARHMRSQTGCSFQVVVEMWDNYASWVSCVCDVPKPPTCQPELKISIWFEFIQPLKHETDCGINRHQRQEAENHAVSKVVAYSYLRLSAAFPAIFPFFKSRFWGPPLFIVPSGNLT